MLHMVGVHWRGRVSGYVALHIWVGLATVYYWCPVCRWLLQMMVSSDGYFGGSSGSSSSSGGWPRLQLVNRKEAG